MLISNSENYKTLSREANLFAQKTSRSIVEVQQNVNNLADILVLLEVLGYNENLVKKHGFENLYELATYVYDFIDSYYDPEQNKISTNSLETPIPTQRQRLAEGLALIFPWLGSLLLLFLTGISLWMALGLPKSITTAFVGGVFLGLFLTEGPLQAFTRLFTFYNNQANMGEVKRILKRSYFVMSVVLSSATVGLFVTSYVLNFSYSLAMIAAVSMVTVSLNRVSYMIIYTLKKTKQLLISYGGAFTTIVAVYYLAEPIIQSDTMRYFVALGSAFAVLSVFSIVNNQKLMTKTTLIPISEKTPHFYNPMTLKGPTLKSKLSIQMWESLPHLIFGILYFSMMFGDRIISWLYHPDIVSGSRHFAEFNSAYHAGADLGLLVILSSAMLQYFVMAPIYLRINNMILHLDIMNTQKIEDYVRDQYRRLLVLSLTVSASTALILIVFAPQIIASLGGSEQTVFVLRIAALSNVLLSIFATNFMFSAFLNRIKVFIFLVLISVVILVVGGLELGKLGYQNIIVAYLAAILFSVITSSIYVRKILKYAGNIYFSRFV